MKLFSTKAHGVLDYLSVGTLLALPRMLGWSEGVKMLLTNAAIGTLGYSLLTKYELGLWKKLPMKGHLALDAMSGAMLLAAPLMFPDEDGSVKGALVGLGIFELTAALTTETEPSFGEQLSQESERLMDTINDAATGRRERALGA